MQSGHDRASDRPRGPAHRTSRTCLVSPRGAVAVGAAPSPSDGAPSPLADASSRPLSPPRERHGPCRAAAIEPPTGRVVPPTAPRVRAVGAAPSPLEQRHRRRTGRHRRWQTRVAVLSRHPGSVTGRAERPRSSLRPAAWSRPPHLAYVPCLAVAVGAVAVGAAPSPSDGAPSPLADASSRPLSPPRERHGPCRAATIEPPTGRVVPPTAPRVRAVGAAPSPLEQRHRRRTGRHRRWQTRVAVLSRHPGSVTGRAERPRSSLRPAAWSRPPHLAYVPWRAVAVGAAPSPSDGAPSPLADASSRPLSPPRERHGPCRAATIEPPTGRVVPPTAPRVRALSRRRRWRRRRWSSAIAVGRCAIAVGRRE